MEAGSTAVAGEAVHGVSDELATPAPASAKGEALSAPILVDNHPPRVEGLALQDTRLRGSASDALGPVSLLELSLDGGASGDVLYGSTQV